SKVEKNPKMITYKETTRILKMWRAKMKFQRKNAISDSLAESSHCSVRKAKQDIFPYVKVMAKNGLHLDMLEKEDVDWLCK
ncbi:hypothetical protein ACFLZN_01210, partial [Nanoarchaeota archaeon]